MASKKGNKIAVFTELLGRMKMAALLGRQYGGKRDIYEALGYPKEASFEDYYARYERQDVARAVIDKPVDATWRGGFTIEESGDDKETTLEKEFKGLYDRLKLVAMLSRVDRLAGIGQYGALLLGLSDVSTIPDWAQPVTASTGLSIVYLRPLSEGSCKIQSLEDDPTDPRFGLPKYYKVELGAEYSEEFSLNVPNKLRVHWSRIIHVAEGELEVDLFGTPRLKPILNRLYDLEKLVGGSAEMFWRNARPGYQGKVDQDYTFTPETAEALQKQLEEFEHDLRRFLVNEGVSLEQLASQVYDPASHVDVQIQMISAVTGIPKRVLTGSERGELASTQDRDNWFDYVNSRRNSFAEPNIIRPFIDRLIELRILPEPSTGRYSVRWAPLYETSDKDKAEVGRIRAEALKSYFASPQTPMLMPPSMFYRFFLGLDQEQIELIENEVDAQIQEEQALIDASRMQQVPPGNPDNTNEPSVPEED